MELLFELTKIITPFILGYGLYLNYKQMKTNNTQRKNELISNVLFKLLDDKDISNIFYKLEYNAFKYSDSFHHSKEEVKLDKILVLFNILSKQYYDNLIEIDDIEEISYDMMTVYQNQEVQKYLAFLDGWYKDNGYKKMPYSNFRKLAKEVKLKHISQEHNKS